MQRFRRHRQRGVEAHLLANARYADELRELSPDDHARMHFLDNRGVGAAVARLEYVNGIPPVLRRALYRPFHRTLFLRNLRVEAKRLIGEHGIEVVHEVNPVSPREPSGMHGLGVPVVIGPLNGGIDPMPGFGYVEPRIQQPLREVIRAGMGVFGRLSPGKREAEVVLAANPRTRDALPPKSRGEVIVFCENGVDRELWRPPEAAGPGGSEAEGTAGPVRFAYLGRMVAWKAHDVLIEAIGRLNERGIDAELHLLGRGVDEPQLRSLAAEGSAPGRIHFLGFMSQPEAAAVLAEMDVFCLPSVQECGGAVVLEAMALGLPVIVTDWGGPSDYVTGAEGFRVQASSREELVAGFTEAMETFARVPELRQRMGRAGLDRTSDPEFDWDQRAGWMLGLLERTARPSGEAP